MTYSYAKVQGQRSAGSEVRVETNGQTEEQTDGQTVGGDCITSHANATGKNKVATQRHLSCLFTAQQLHWYGLLTGSIKLILFHLVS